jgi:hypothetical protein
MNYLNCTPSPQSKYTALLYSVCTAHFLQANDQCTNKLLTATPLEVRLTNGATIASTHTATLNKGPSKLSKTISFQDYVQLIQTLHPNCVINFYLKQQSH